MFPTTFIADIGAKRSVEVSPLPVGAVDSEGYRLRRSSMNRVWHIVVILEPMDVSIKEGRKCRADMRTLVQSKETCSMLCSRRGSEKDLFGIG